MVLSFKLVLEFVFSCAHQDNTNATTFEAFGGDGGGLGSPMLRLRGVRLFRIQIIPVVLPFRLLWGGGGGLGFTTVAASGS